MTYMAENCTIYDDLEWP